MSTKSKAAAPAAAEDTTQQGPDWLQEWIDPRSIVRLCDWQVRSRLDPTMVRRYAERTQEGHTPPPIRVARVVTPGGPVLHLIDGWHRLEAGALQQGMGRHRGRVLAEVADLREQDARWEAAKANMDHGVPLKPSDYRRVLAAFIKAGKHRKPGGKLMSLRELAAVIGKGHRTIHEWIKKDHRSLHRAMGGHEGGNPDGEAPRMEHEPLHETHKREALAALENIHTGAPAMTPEGRGEVAEDLEALLARLRGLGLKKPEHY